MAKKINKTDQTTESGEQKNQTKELIIQQMIQWLQWEIDEKECAKITKELIWCTSYESFLQKIEEKIEKYDVQWTRELLSILNEAREVFVNSKEESTMIKFITDNNIKEVNEQFLALPDDKRLLVTKYRHEHNEWENYFREKNYGCGKYGSFKDPSDCWSCVSWRTNLAKAWVRKLAEYKGDRCYKIPEEIVENAKLWLFTEQEKKEIQEIITYLNEQAEKIKIMEQEMKTKKGLIDFFQTYKDIGSYQQVKKQWPEFAAYVEENQLYNKYFKKLDIHQNDKLVLYVMEGSQINGTGPMTYWITTTIWYDGQEKSFRHIVRDPSNPDRYDTSFYSPTIEIKKKKEEGEHITFAIRVHNKDKSDYLDYTATFKKAIPDIEAKLNEQEQQKFQEFFQQTMEKTCKSETRENGIMFSRIGNTRNQISREKAEVTDKALDLKNGKGAFIIKTQIDCWANASDYNKQYWRRGYIVTADGKVENVRYECGREAQLGLMDFTISDPKIIDKEKVNKIFATTAQSLLEKSE